MSNDEEAGAAAKQLSDQEWAKLLATAMDYARTKVVGGRPYRKMAPDHPLWNDLVNEFVTAAAVVKGEDGPKAAAEVSARQYEAGKVAADRFFNEQFRLPARRERSFADDRTKAYFGVPARDDDGQEWVGDPADQVIGDSGDMLNRLARQQMVRFIREAIDRLSPTLRQVVQLAGGIGDIPELDGYEPRDPNRDGSGGGQPMRAVEIAAAPGVGVGERQVRNLLKRAKAEILETLLEKHKYTVSDIEEYFPGFTSED